MPTNTRASVPTGAPRQPRKGANLNPAQVVLDSRQKRRTAAEIQADKEAAARERAESLAQEKNLQQHKIKSTAVIEDALRQEDILKAKSAAQPDRQPAKKGRPQKASAQAPKATAQAKKSNPRTVPTINPAAQLCLSEDLRTSREAPAQMNSITTPQNAALENTEAATDENPSLDTSEQLQTTDSSQTDSFDNDDESEQLDTLPPELTVDTDSDGMAIEWNDDHDPQDDENLDYAEQPAAGSDEELEAEDASDAELDMPVSESRVQKQPKRAGTDRSLRQHVNTARDRPSSTPIPSIATKRRAESNSNSISVEYKRAKKADLPGLSKDWRKRIIERHSATVVATTEDPVAPSSGFDDVEDLGPFSAVNNSRLSMRVTHEAVGPRMTKDMVKVKVENIKIQPATNDNTTPNLSYRKLPVACLPFPQDGAQGQECALKWKRDLKATAIAFSAAQAQPFTANALLHEHAENWWDKVFEFSITEYWTWTAKLGDALPAIVEQISKIVTEWRSSIGKEGLNLIEGIIVENRMSKEEIVDWVAEMREDFRWLYKDPDGPVGSKGAFQSDLVLELFAFHQKLAMASVVDHGLPIGGLALCAAAIERALEIWAEGEKKKDGVNSERDGPPNRKRVQNTPSFGGETWVKATAGYVGLAGGLKADEQWVEILDAVEARMPRVLARDFRLVILNGTAYERGVAGALTSHQPGGSSTIDYILVSAAFASTLAPGCMTVTGSEWSDHDCLRLRWTPRLQAVETVGDNGEDEVLRTRAQVRRGWETTDLDRRIQDMIALAEDPALMTDRVYGLAVLGAPPVTRYVAVTHKGASGAFSVVSRPGSPANRTYRLRDCDNCDRATLLAVGEALLSVPEDVPVILYMASTSVIRTLTYRMGEVSAGGWDVGNGETLASLCRVIQCRRAQLELRVVRKSPVNEHWECARALSRRALRVGLGTDALGDWTSRRPESEGPRAPAGVATGRKVITTIPEVPARPKAVVLPGADELAEGDEDAHRGRWKEQRAQATNLWRWLTADSAREWWECVRMWTDPKPKAAQVTGRQLRESFMKRLNPPAVPPAHFDLGVRSRFARLSGLIPTRTTDKTPGLFFSSPVTEEEIVLAKRKLRDRSTKSARGIDSVSYRIGLHAVTVFTVDGCRQTVAAPVP
ncbi:hypothetical protein H0H92_001857, partial [Tricholoma furcatifolium]